MEKKSIYIEDLSEVAQCLSNAYSTVMSETSLVNLVDNVLGADTSKYSHTSARELINRIILGSYPNEMTVKANFVNRILLPQNPTNVAIFELPIGKSRVDMCKINGHSAAYEIKTDFDTFTRLKSQLKDYFDVFEAVYVITSDRRWQDLFDCIPDECGIYSYRQSHDGSLTFCVRRAAEKSNIFDSEKQLSAMPKKHLCSLLGVKGYNVSKHELIDHCLLEFDHRTINLFFKKYLKQRYSCYWDRFCELHPDIFEIDYQWFYRYGLSPQTVY